MNIIDEMRNDILNGEELQYDYEIDGVSVTVLMDYSGDEIQIIATKDGKCKTWEFAEWSVLAVLKELTDFIQN